MCRLVTTSCRRPRIEHGKDGLWRIVNEFGECLSVHDTRAKEHHTSSQTTKPSLTTHSKTSSTRDVNGLTTPTMLTENNPKPHSVISHWVFGFIVNDTQCVTSSQSGVQKPKNPLGYISHLVMACNILTISVIKPQNPLGKNPKTHWVHALYIV